MILLPAPVTAYQELSFFFYPFSISLSFSFSLLFFVICTPNRAELLQYGSGGGGGSAGSRKSQINPFVIPHRSFQPVRISTTRFYATSAPFQNSSFPLASPYRPVKGENYSIVSIFFLSSPFLDSHYPIFSSFFFLLPFLSLVFRCIFANPRPRSFPPFSAFSPLYFPRPYRAISVQVSATRLLIAFVSYAFPA